MTLSSWMDDGGQSLQRVPALPATRDRIIEAAHLLFQQHGYGRVSVDSIAETASVTKRTLYHHFRSKDDLLAETAEMRSAKATVHLRQRMTPAPVDNDAFIDELFDEIAGPRNIATWTGVGFTRIALELTHLPGHPARALARRHKVDLEGWLSDELRTRRIRDPAGTARDVMLLLEGSLVLVIMHGDRAYADRAANAAKALVKTRRIAPADATVAAAFV